MHAFSVTRNWCCTLKCLLCQHCTFYAQYSSYSENLIYITLLLTIATCQEPSPSTDGCSSVYLRVHVNFLAFVWEVTINLTHNLSLIFSII